MYTEEHFFAETLAPSRISYLTDFCAEADTVLRYDAFSKQSFKHIFSSIHDYAKKQNTPIRILHNPLDGSVCGWMLPDYRNGAIHTAPFDYTVRNYFSAANFTTSEKIQEFLLSAQQIFSQAHAIHDKQEEIYISRMDFDLANILCEAVLTRLLPQKQMEENTEKGKQINRFFGAPTVYGNVCYIPELTEKISKRYFVKGRPGTGKSTFLKRIASAVSDRGYTVYVYHCSFDPKSLDMIVVPELDFCIFDSTAPHEYFPIRLTDEILDLYRECVVPGTDEEFKNTLDALESEYKEKLADGLVYLKKAKAEIDALEALIPNLEKNALEAETNYVLKLMFKL